MSGGGVGLVLVLFETSVELPEPIRLSHEHTDYRWMTFEEAAQSGSDAVIHLVHQYPSNK